MKTFGGSSFTDSVPVPYLEGSPSARAPGLYARFGKRLFDIALALVLLPMIVPMIMVVWALTRCDGGPGFYSQYRVGRNGRIFKCWKVRTMVMDAERILSELCEKDPAIAEEWKTNQKLENDPRITPVGKFLRMTSLDELPQIWNILVGDMSFIGPRPFMTSQDSLYRAAGGQAYFRLRPGLTGPWQVEGRGASTFADRVRFDEAYLARLSLKTDLRLVWLTVKVLLKGTGH
ncbi:sugar transferase [Pseudooceanicola marinus]|uniref:sugar transferase n=1 Tax=Pseudooceanicola marinus TaxID=396013 RepID=UPI001CD3A858|nr:sugar transferase [Pseudooceanicola marinus]MCA1338190.1 sugar transferase [Pseudooceanicola marinus]